METQLEVQWVVLAFLFNLPTVEQLALILDRTRENQLMIVASREKSNLFKASGNLLSSSWVVTWAQGVAKR
jgi:hypothetical protein